MLVSQDYLKQYQIYLGLQGLLYDREHQKAVLFHSLFVPEKISPLHGLQLGGWLVP